MARRSRVLAAAVAAALCLPALAVEDVPSGQGIARAVDAFNPYLTIGYGYDSNIYRLDEEAPEIGQSRWDQYAMGSIGINANVYRALQHYQLYGELNHTLFGEHDDLDYTGSKAGVLWYWALSEGTTGTFGGTHVRALRDFSNQITLERIRDLRMENKVLGSAEFDVTGPWKFGARGEFADISFSESNRLDLQRVTAGASVGYASSAGSTVGLEAEYVTGDYDNNPLSDYDEYSVGPTLDWKFTERTTLHARVSYTNRDQSDPIRQDYDGVTGRVSVDFDNGERNGLKVAAYRDLSNLGDEVLEYAEVTGVEVEPRWQLRPGLDLRIRAAYELRDFNRDPDAELIGLDPNRDDDVVTAGAFVDWQFHRSIKLSIGVDMQKRDSTRELQDYDFSRVEIRLTGSL